MPPKPKPTRVDWRGETVANPNADDPALKSINLPRRNWAIDALHADIEARLPTENRFVRVREQIMAHWQCSKASAERTIREAKQWLAEEFDKDLPNKRVEMCTQLQRIADANEEEQPMAAVAALRELAKIFGLYAPKELDVNVGISLEQRSAVGALKLSPHERRVRIDELRARAALPAVTTAADDDDDDDDIDDA